MPQLKSSGRLPPPLPGPGARRSVPRLPTLPKPPTVAKVTTHPKPPPPPARKSAPKARTAPALLTRKVPAPTPTPTPKPTAAAPVRHSLRDLKTGEVLNVSEAKTTVAEAPTNEIPALKPRALTMLDAKELPMAPVRNEHYRALRALADELDAYLTEVERDKAWWREPRFVIVSQGEAVGVILQPRPKRKKR